MDGKMTHQHKVMNPACQEITQLLTQYKVYIISRLANLNHTLTLRV